MSTAQLWIAGILAILRVLISQSTEDIVLSRIQELSFSAHLLCCPIINRLRDGGSNSVLEEHSEGRQTKDLPEETFSRYALYRSLPRACPQAAVWCLGSLSLASALRGGLRDLCRCVFSAQPASPVALDHACLQALSHPESDPR